MKFQSAVCRFSPRFVSLAQTRKWVIITKPNKHSRFAFVGDWQDGGTGLAVVPGEGQLLLE
jgi:hypothetical protein